MEARKRVGILGSGRVGQQLGRGFAKRGYEVMLGSRNPTKLEEWRRETGGTVAIGTFADAAAFGELVILATSGAATEDAIELADVRNFVGKLVLDATNPLDLSHGMPPGLLLDATDSLGEKVQRKLPESKVVKCFNTVGNSKFIDPTFRDGTPPMLICGNDLEAKKETDAIVRELGWPGAMDVGAIDAARWLEALVPLWLRAAQDLNTREFAFKIVQ